MELFFPLLPPTPSPIRIGAEHLYVISQDAGLCLFEAHFGDATPTVDPDLGSALFMAVLKLALEVAHTDVRSMHLGDGYLMFASSPAVVMILQARKGADVQRCQELLWRLNQEFNDRFGEQFKKSWNGNIVVFAPFEEVIANLNSRETALREREESIAIRNYMWNLNRRRGQKGKYLKRI